MYGNYDVPGKKARNQHQHILLSVQFMIHDNTLSSFCQIETYLAGLQLGGATGVVYPPSPFR